MFYYYWGTDTQLTKLSKTYLINVDEKIEVLSDKYLVQKAKILTVCFLAFAFSRTFSSQ
jgi:hypothetical protein